MPTRKSASWPPPENWEEFEQLCRDLFARIWGDPSAQRNGRTGQRQNGVDVFGRPDGQDGYAGVQARRKLDSSVSPDELVLAVEEARRFEPRLALFVLATTARNDSHIQEQARLLSEDALKSDGFRVEVWSWDELCDKMAEYPELLSQYYPQWTPTWASVRVKRGSIPKTLKRVHSGDALLAMLTGCEEIAYEYDDPRSVTEREAIAQFLSHIGDCDVVPDLGPGFHVEFAGALDDALQALNGFGVWVFAEVHTGSIESSIAAPQAWRTCHLRLAHSDSTDIRSIGLKPACPSGSG